MITNSDKQKYKIDYLQRSKDGKIPRPNMIDLICETQLDAIGDFVPLDVKINLSQFKQEIAKYDGQWQPYLPREGELNDRQGLNFVGLEGDTPFDSISLPEVMKRTGKTSMKETDFTVPTQLYHDLPSLHPLVNHFPELGRCTLVKVNKGGWFPMHRDSLMIGRHAFRIVAFLTNTGHECYEWEHDYTRRSIEEGRCYYVDTRKAHRTHSYVNDSIHLVMNIPKTWDNVLRVCNILRHKEA